jgi:hypothetical protein
MATSSGNQYRSICIVLVSTCYAVLVSHQLFKYLRHGFEKIQYRYSPSRNATLLNFPSTKRLPTDHKDVLSVRADEGAKISTQMNTPPASQCWRSDCPSPRKNQIFFPYRDSAGWNDRLFIFSRLANLAGYLCADLHILSPSILLHKQHNNGMRLNDDLKWSDFLVLNFGYNQTIQEGDQSGFVDPDSKALEVVSNTPDGNWEKLLQLENFTFAQIEEKDLSHGFFMWRINTNFYSMDIVSNMTPGNAVHPRPASFPLGFPHSRNDGCKYGRFSQPSKYTSRVVDEVILQHGLNLSLYDRTKPITGVLHLRRGDAKGSCATSPEKVKSFLECSFANTRDVGNFTLLLSTDEYDPAYISEIIKLPDGNNALSHVKIQRLDFMVRNCTESLIQSGDIPPSLSNNYFIFFVSMRIWEKTRFKLARRRDIDCSECTSVSKHIGR